MEEIGLWLDSYDDIYSDFDNRHYQKRRISEDFLYELQTEMKTKNNGADILVLFLPQQQRNVATEKLISDSLGGYFLGQYQLHQNKCRQKLRSGIFLVSIGLVVIIANSWVSSRLGRAIHIISLRVILEPAGWFLLWTGLDSLFYDFKALKKERDFFKQLSGISIQFKSDS